MQIIRNRREFDVCVVGSGAGGGMAAKVLTEAGADVVMLEAGVMWDAARDAKMFAWTYDAPHRGAPIPERQFGELDAGLGGWTLDGEPYTTGPDSRFDWFRTRMLGGRTNHWGRISLRFGPDDFRRRSLDGLGDDWPIGYDDLKPYYDQVDDLVGVFGTVEGLHNEPDGHFLPPPRPRCYELLFKQAADRLKITCISSRLSILTRPHNGRKACHYCGQCGRGCAIHANFSSPSVLLPPALATGRLTLVTRAMAREVTTDETGLATGVAYIDTTTGRENHVRARIVVLAASACESARILLNSTSSRFPHGLANSSGAVGRYLTDTTGVSVSGFIPKMMHGVPHNEDGVGGMHLYMPWWLDNRTLDFPRGYHIEPGGGRRMPGAGFLGGIHRFRGTDGDGQAIAPAGYGKALKDDYRRFYGATRQLRGPRRDDPQREQLLRDRPRGGRSLGHPGAALPLQVERLRIQPGAPHAAHLPRPHRRDGRHGAVADAVARARLRHRAGRTHHPRGRGDADGALADHLGAERAVPGPRRAQPVRGRRRPVRHQRRQERDLDDPGAGDADQRVHRRRAQGGAAVMAGMRRRDLLRLLAAAPAAAGFSWNEAEASAAHALAQAAGAAQPAGTPFTPAFFTAHEYETVRLLADLILPRDERSGGAVDAGVPEFMDFLLAEEPKLPEASRRQTAMRGGLAWLDLECQRRFDATFVTCRDEQRTALLDDISQPPPVDPDADAGVAARRLARPRVLRQLPRSHGHRVLDQPDGHGRPAVPGQSGRGRLDRLSASGPGEARRPLPGRVTTRPRT